MSEDSKYLTGHPKEMIFLAFTEMSQRFAFWGIGNLLVLYLVKSLQFPTAKASHIYGIFTGISFILPIFGGYLADRLGYKKPLFLGCTLTALGCILLGFQASGLLYISLLLIALGAAIFTPSIYALLGHVYHGHHNKREIGFSIYYASVNIGVFLAMIVLGITMKFFGWGVVFFLAGFIQLLGLIPLYFATKYIKKPKHHQKTKKNKTEKIKLTKYDKDRFIVIAALSVVSIIFWTAYSQNGSSMVIFALKYTNRMLGNFEMPTPWLISTESFFLLVLVLPLTYFYHFLRKRKMEPSPPLKTVYSLTALGVCFFLLMISANKVPLGATSSSISPFYIIGSFAFMSLAELLIAPISLSLITNLTPKRFTAMFVGIWYFCIGVSFYIGGVLGGFIASVRISNFFSYFMWASFLTAAILFIFYKKLNKLRHIKHLKKNIDK